MTTTLTRLAGDDCPQWCDPGRCSAGAGRTGTHRSAPIQLTADDATATVALWQRPRSVDNPNPSLYLTLVETTAVISEAFEIPGDRRTVRRRVRALLRNDLNDLTAKVRRSAA
jgi:hypothetical protein